MKYAIAAIVSAMMIVAGIALAGAGHGWESGAFGCFALAAVCFVVWSNALSQRPSRRIAITALAVGLLVCAGVVVATASEGSEYMVRLVRSNGLLGLAVVALAYLNLPLMSLLALHRSGLDSSRGT